MAIFLSEADIRSLVTIQDAVDAVDKVFRHQGEGGVINPPRQQIDMPGGGYLRLTSAIVGPMKKLAVKVSCSSIFESNSGRTLILVDAESGRVDAIIEVHGLGAMRTAAASGVATDALALPDADSIGIVGAGRQAETQIAAICCVRPIKRVVVAARSQERLASFCQKMSKELGIPVTPAERPDDIYDCPILVAATTSAEPVLFGDKVRPGTHINAIGANRLERQEIDDAVIPRCAIITVDNKVQSKLESAALLRAVEQGAITWDDVQDLGEYMTGPDAGKRAADAITLYNSHGVAMEDVALGTKAWELATEKGVGVEVPFTPN
jgi:ornithine cyclodeaminase/alanine dehydrogenase-like protein (mu-crystallin family)